MSMMLLSAFLYVASAQTESVKALVSAIGRGNVSSADVRFAQQVEVSLVGKTGVLDASGAIGEIDSFLAKLKVADCKVSHQGAKENSGFCILSMKASDRGSEAHEYRIYVYFRNVGGDLEVKQFRIDYVR